MCGCLVASRCLIVRLQPLVGSSALLVSNLEVVPVGVEAPTGLAAVSVSELSSIFSECVSVSELSDASPYFRLLNAIRSRQANVKRQWEFFSSASNRQYAREGYAVFAHAALNKLRDLEVRLDNSSLIDNTAEYQRVSMEFRSMGSVKEMNETIFGDPNIDRRSTPEDPLMIEMLDVLKKGCRKARVSELRWRMEAEIEQRVNQGWFVIFNTLTVSPRYYEEVFEAGSRCWRDYIRSIDRLVGRECYGSVRAAAASGDAFHQYCAVVERGGSSGRLHIHCIHLVKKIPLRWRRDPNAGARIPSRREINSMKSLWTFGFSTPIACRFADSDAFGLIGWRWPVQLIGRHYSPVASKPALALARYMSKYIVKAYDLEDSKQWRFRMSRGFGLSQLRMTMNSLRAESLLGAMLAPEIRYEIAERMVPPRILKVELLRSLLKQKKTALLASGSSGSPMLTILRSLKAVPPRPPIAERLRFSKKPIHDFNWLSSGNSVLRNLRTMGVFDVRRRLEDSVKPGGRRFLSFGGNCERGIFRGSPSFA